MNTALVQSILNAMQSVIDKHGLELMQRYPNDLLVHDKSMLERFAVPGAKIAWMVGHSHTHMVPLGFNKKEQDLVTCLTNMSNDDRFYVLDIEREKFKMKEVDRKEFAALNNTAVNYDRKGTVSNFWLYRGDRKIGHVALDSIGTMEKPVTAVKITPVAGTSEHEAAALKIWSEKAAVERAGTLFIRYETTWAEPYAPRDEPAYAPR